jgi:hypothetical protein
VFDELKSVVMDGQFKNLKAIVVEIQERIARLDRAKQLPE